ncbi:YopX family protein [Campylobacter sp. RKI_CA19_01116]|uniref:YopX family protein n=1 Tax=Campylobacter sp. RKI_CA19_01116 TaxID=2911625 RepID=UPI0021E852A8|nr:YopX family protein [Campylobacter sp. RKI_CA19_01116]MCV3397302.1 YopX family protein [Campylobacter sp. RKI_CA19_01116]
MKLKDFDFRIWGNNLKAYIIKNRTISKYSDSIDREDSLAGFIRRETHYGDLVFDNWSCDCEIELWTGLYDKNGKKIYEGDIVRYFECEILVIKFRYGVFMACPDYDEFLKKFEYDKNDEGVKENWLEMSYKLYRQARNGVCDRLEIIGNIHENHI